MDTLTDDVRILHQCSLPRGGRFLIVGDLHGQLDMLLRLLLAADYDESRDILISVGDLIDRGDQSLNTAFFFVNHPRRFGVLGNHEGYLLEASGLPADAFFWMSQGGDWAKIASRASLQGLNSVLSRCPIAIELMLENPTRRIGILHAEVPIGMEWDDLHQLHIERDKMRELMLSPAEDWLRGRHRIRTAAMMQDWLDHPEGSFPFGAYELTTPGIDLVISGHSILPHRLPYRSRNQLWIDTGAFERELGGRLTLVDPVAETYWQVSSDDAFGPSSLNDPRVARLGPLP